MEEKVFGFICKSYLLGSNIERLCAMKEIIANCIVLYMRYLYDVLKKANMLSMIGFVNPALISANGCGNVAKRSRKLADDISKTCNDKIFLIPCNHGKHWALTLVNPNKRIVYFTDPLRRRSGGEEWKLVVDNGLKIFNTKRNIQMRKSVQWKIMTGAPEQPTNKECGYFVMRYIKDIIEDENSTFMTKWEKKMGRTYTQQKIDDVRCEWADFLQNYMHDE